MSVKQAISAYYEVANRISMNPSIELAELKSVASGELLQSQVKSMKEWRAKGYRSTKPVEITNLNVKGFADEQGTRTAVATYCIDLTGVDVVDRDGKSQVVDSRPDQYPAVTHLSQLADGRWILFHEHNVGDGCNGA